MLFDEKVHEIGMSEKKKEKQKLFFLDEEDDKENKVTMMWMTKKPFYLLQV